MHIDAGLWCYVATSDASWVDSCPPISSKYVSLIEEEGNES